MPEKYCCVCGNSKSKDSNYSFPSNNERRLEWLKAFQIEASEVKPHWRVCSRHFPDGGAKKKPKFDLRKEILVSNQERTKSQESEGKRKKQTTRFH